MKTEAIEEYLDIMTGRLHEEKGSSKASSEAGHNDGIQDEDEPTDLELDIKYDEQAKLRRKIMATVR